ncbi:MAG: hypothetical protein OXC11_14795 [Rhodospirillales bacterium]|nr:hypothetical protein [Rhodospirillales bacterium]
MLSALVVLFSLVATACPVGMPGCGDSQATDLVKNIFNQNSGYRARRVELISTTAQDMQTRTCQGQIVDTDGDKWLVTYTMSPSATNSGEFVLRADWQFAGAR